METKKAQKTRKVFFFPYYWYLHYEPFRRVIVKLIQSGIDGRMVYMPCGHIAESTRFGIEAARQDGCPAMTLPVCNVGSGSGTPLSKGLRFLGLILSRCRIKTFLRTEKPDVVVVGSDLGNSYIRLLLDQCHLLHIHVLIMVTIVSWATSENMSLDVKPTIPSNLRLVLRTLKLDQILIEKRITGSYHREALLAVPCGETKEQLIQQGIDRDRIVITGNPLHDQFYEIRQSPAREMKNELCKLMGFPIDCRLIIYCTEMIQEVDGEDYLERINKLLVHTFDSLPEECRVVVKLHPRESEVSLSKYSQIFIGDRYRVVKDVHIHNLLRSADIAIAHFSNILVEAALLGTPVLSINISGDRSRMLFGPGLDLLYIRSVTELRKIISDVLYDQEFLALIKSSLLNLSSNYAAAIDGRNSERVSCLIQSIVESQKYDKWTSRV